MKTGLWHEFLSFVADKLNVAASYRLCIFRDPMKPARPFIVPYGWVIVWLTLLLCRQAMGEGYRRGMVASGHPLATVAGLKALKGGGNAVDAAVAVGLTLGVVDGHNSGIGGGCFMLIRLATGEFVALDGREMAPGAATRDMFVKDGVAVGGRSQTGPLAVGIPGQVAVFERASREYGRLALADALRAAAEVAEGGFAISANYASRLRGTASDLQSFAGSREVFFRDGQPLQKGEVLRQPDLATTYRAMAEHGTDWFYKGPFAERVAAWMQENGGIITSDDFAQYELKVREPIRSRYREHDIISFPPPSSGGVHVAQILNILEHFDLKAMDEVTRIHVMAEAMKLAFADRAHWLGDADFVKVPRGLVSTNYAAVLAGRIQLDRVLSVEGHGTPMNADGDVFGDRHTTHFSVADEEGNWVACTSTVNTAFGSKVIVPGTGVILNNQIDDFSVQPGVANFFGLMGAEANAIEPRKRPLSSMSPTIVMKDGMPLMAVGAAGGPRIITSVLHVLTGLMDHGMSSDEAMAGLRIHHQWSPNELMVEKGVRDEVRVALVKRGHRVREMSAGSIAHLVYFDEEEGFVGVADPRGEGAVAGW